MTRPTRRTLFDVSAPVRFDGTAGPAYQATLDQTRLTRQLGRVFDSMRDATWRTLQEIANITGDPQASISAQLRHLRKPRFGCYTIENRRRGEPARGLYEYRLIVPKRGSASAEESHQ